MSLAHSEQEIIRAHDLLVGLLLGETGVEVRGEAAMRAAADVLCWLLGHAHNTSFEENLTRLELLLAEHGLVLKEVESPAYDDDPRDQGQPLEDDTQVGSDPDDEDD